MTMKKAVTIYTLAEELGMTPSMVSRALNPDGKVAEEKRQMVLEAARRHDFVPNKFASRLSGRTVKIGILIYVKADHVREQMIQGIERAYHKTRDYKIESTVKVIKSSEKAAQDCEEELFALAGYDGVILAGFSSGACVSMIRRFLKVNPNVVFMQNVCEGTDYLFASKHNEELASELAAELLGNRLYHSPTKNVLLFTGSMDSSVHRRAGAAFRRCCPEYQLNLLDSIDMNDSEDYLKEHLGDIMERYGTDLDGIYITSGNSIALCEYVRRERAGISLVTFDVYNRLHEYIEDGTITATIFQNIALQAENAFDRLVSYLIEGELPERTVYTNVIPVLKSNLLLYR